MEWKSEAAQHESGLLCSAWNRAKLFWDNFATAPGESIGASLQSTPSFGAPGTADACLRTCIACNERVLPLQNAALSTGTLRQRSFWKAYIATRLTTAHFKFYVCQQNINRSGVQAVCRAAAALRSQQTGTSSDVRTDSFSACSVCVQCCNVIGETWWGFAASEHELATVC